MPRATWVRFSQGCTIREAIIVGSVVAKVSIPVLHGAAALFRLAAVEPNQWIPSVSLMMTVLIDKKYSLPIQVCTARISGYNWPDLHMAARNTRSRRLPVAGDLFSPCNIVLQRLSVASAATDTQGRLFPLVNHKGRQSPISTGFVLLLFRQLMNASTTSTGFFRVM